MSMLASPFTPSPGSCALAGLSSSGDLSFHAKVLNALVSTSRGTEGNGGHSRLIMSVWFSLG
jgi:hypothetical protein